MPCKPIPFEKITRRISYANNVLVLVSKERREKALEMLKEITSDFCIEKSDGTKVTVRARHNGRTILVDLQVEKSRINDWWLVTITPHF
jgi:hypothetical protein